VSGERRAVVDLRSDTVTRPGAGMRQAMATATVGDDAFGDDPTVQLLERRTADLLGHEAALFFPSGIMANQTALLLLAPPGTEVICEAAAHVVDWELGGAAMNAGVQVRPVAAPDGMTVASVLDAIRPRSAPLQIQTSLIALENTHNAAGGRVLPLERMRAIRALASEHGLPVHLDGARLWHAATASGVTEADYAACADTVMVTLSKGLGCPVGSLLAGTRESIRVSRIIRRRLGGSMRQVGILAAAGLYALDNNRDRLHEDHDRARNFAALVAEIDGINVVSPETNIVMLDITRPGMTAEAVLQRLAEQSVLMTAFTATRIRAVTHLDVDDEGIERAANALARAFDA
jgi:threonine aldolase